MCIRDSDRQRHLEPEGAVLPQFPEERFSVLPIGHEGKRRIFITGSGKASRKSGQGTHLPGGTFLVLTREEGKECPPLRPGMSPESACTLWCWLVGEGHSSNRSTDNLQECPSKAPAPQSCSPLPYHSSGISLCGWRCGHRVARVALAAAIVRSKSRFVCARETHPASNWAGAR